MLALVLATNRNPQLSDCGRNLPFFCPPVISHFYSRYIVTYRFSVLPFFTFESAQVVRVIARDLFG